jgi:hypothetical protein
MSDFETTLTMALQSDADRTTRALDGSTAAARLDARLDQVDHDRDRRTRGALLAAAASVLVAGALYGIAKTHNPTTEAPTGPTPNTVFPVPYDQSEGYPGTYQLYVGETSGGATIDADLNFADDRWQYGNYPVLQHGRFFGGVAVYQPSALAAGSGCLGGKEITSVGKSPSRLAGQLAGLPHSTVLEPPTPTQSFGRQAVHLRLRIDQHCGGGIGIYRVAWTARGVQGISYGDLSKDVVIDFWVTDVHRTPVVAEAWHQVGSPSSLDDQIAHTEGSVKIVTSR